MEWQLVFPLFLVSFFVILLTGIPIAFGFLLLNLIGLYIYGGGQAGLFQLIYSIVSALSNWTLLPIPLFVLLGEVMFHSGMAARMTDALDEWLGRLPGRLSLLAVMVGALFGTMSGSSVSGVALLATTLLPDMEKRGYKKPMTMGPIIGCGALAMMIPPSGMAILLAAVASISVGNLLIAIIIPGLLMAALYAGYIIIRCWLQPSIAPAYEVTPRPVFARILSFLRFVLPLGSIFFLAIGLIFLGVATPSEAAAVGTVGSFGLAALYGKLNWQLVKESALGTIRVSAMIFMILAGAIAFSQVLVLSGATRGLVQIATEVRVAPILIIIAMQIIVLFLGTFMECASLLMITLPIYMPVINALGFDPVWFGAIMMLNMEMAEISPPFGLSLFAMKGLAPPGYTIGDVYLATIPFFLLDMLVMALMVAFPPISLWLVSMMRH